MNEKITTYQIKSLRQSELFDDVPTSSNAPNQTYVDGDGSGKWWALVKTHPTGRPEGATLVIESEICPLDDGSLLNSHTFVVVGSTPFQNAIEAENYIDEVIRVDADGWYQWKP